MADQQARQSELPLDQRLRRFTARVVTEDLAAMASERCAMPVGEAKLLLDTYANEAHAGLRLIASSLRPGMRILDVGSGIGVLAGFLTENGYDVTGIEPGATGFGFMSEMAAAVGARVERPGGFQPLPIGAGELCPDKHGTFDLIYSVNVVEHIGDLDGAFRAMASVLDPAGMMIHDCPNYTVPFEPHYGIPLLPFRPAATRYIFPRVTSKYPGLWDSLNFVTAGRIRRIARANSLDLAFDRGIMGEAVRRLDRDPVFRSRQGALGRVLAGLSRLGFARLLEAVPPGLATPMIMRMRHRRQAVNGPGRMTRRNIP